MARVDLTVNGQVHQVDVDPARPLLGVLRDDLGLSGTKYGCGEAQCGACTVRLDGRPVRSCVTRVGAVTGRAVTTIEGLGSEDSLHPLQQAFLEQGALQCGYCTPGMIMAAAALLEREPEPTDADIIRAMEGNVCRCGVYAHILAAVRQAASAMQVSRG